MNRVGCRIDFPKLSVILLLVAFLLAASGCKAPATPELPTPMASTESAASPQHTPTAAEATFTPEPNLVVLLSPPDADQQQELEVKTILSELAAEQGYEFEIRQEISQLELESDVRILVTIPPDQGVANLVAANPEVQFLALGIPDLQPSSNLSLIGAQGIRSDQQGFLAGYLAAVITPAWRVGVIARGDTVEGKAARTGFTNGVIFFCGLCRPAYPPFVQYPVYSELQGDAGEAEQKAAADLMVANAVETVYLAPGTGDDFLKNALAGAGINLIGGAPVYETLKTQWVASIIPDQASAIKLVWEALINGKGGNQIDAPIVITDVNPALLSPGRQHLVESILSELLADFISTGVDLQTGEPGS